MKYCDQERTERQTRQQREGRKTSVAHPVAGHIGQVQATGKGTLHFDHAAANTQLRAPQERRIQCARTMQCAASHSMCVRACFTRARVSTRLRSAEAQAAGEQRARGRATFALGARRARR